MSKTSPKLMTTPPLVGWVNDINDYATRRLTSPIDFVIRVWLAQSFFRLGILKTTDPEPTVWLFTFQEAGRGGEAPGDFPSRRCGVARSRLQHVHRHERRPA